MEKNIEIIGMCHLKALPGDNNYNKNINETIERAKFEIEILQRNGFSKILFSNEYSYPYTDHVHEISSIAMAYIVGNLTQYISVPFGIDCMYDSYATINIATAVSANFFRLTIPKLDVDNIILGKANINKLVRYAHSLSLYNDLQLYLNISLALKALSYKEQEELLKIIGTQLSPYAVCVSSQDDYKFLASKLNNKIKIICDGGCNISNIAEISRITNGMVIGTALKKDAKLQNSIDESQVLDIINSIK